MHKAKTKRVPNQFTKDNSTNNTTFAMEAVLIRTNYVGVPVISCLFNECRKYSLSQLSCKC